LNTAELRSKLAKLNTDRGSKAFGGSAAAICVFSATAQLFLVNDQCPWDTNRYERDGCSGNYGRAIARKL